MPRYQYNGLMAMSILQGFNVGPEDRPEDKLQTTLELPTSKIGIEASKVPPKTKTWSNTGNNTMYW